MKTPLFLAACLLAATALAAPTPATASSPAHPASSNAFPYPIQVDHLPNGLTVARVKFASPGLAAYYTVMRVGSRDEIEPGRTGYAHFFEHMMFRGTARYPAGERDRKVIAKYGLSDNAYTSEDKTVYEVFGPNEALPALIDAEADRFQNLSYTESAFRTEAGAVLGEYNKNAADPTLKLYETFLSTAFTRHTYRHTTLGFREDILKMPDGYAYSRSFFQRHYRPENATIVVVGDFDDAMVMKTIREKYSPWKRGAEKTAIPVEPPQNKERTASVEWASPTLPRVWMGWHIPAASLKTEEQAVGAVLGSYLAGPTSPLYKLLVLDKQWVESVAADGGTTRDPNLFALFATIKDPAHVTDVRRAIDGALQNFARGKLDEARIESIKSAVHYGALMELETPPAIVHALIEPIVNFADPHAIDHTLAGVPRVTSKQLVEFAKKYLVDRNRTVITLTHKPSSEAAR